MKKAAIITLQYINNYGSVLQTYASQEVIKKYSFSTEIINYTRENSGYEYLKNDAFQRYRSRNDIFSLYPISKLLQWRWSLIYKKRNLVFDKFRNKYINLSKHYIDYKDLSQNLPIYDIYITGSDQVWNSEYNGGVLGEYFFDFVPNDKLKISLAASFGVDNLKETEKKLIQKMLKEYSGISVREKSAKRIIEDMGINNVVHCVDPTLLLTSAEWINRFQLKKKNKEHILIYQLNNNPEMINCAVHLAEKYNLEIKIISAFCKNINYKHNVIKDCSPEEFLNLIYNSRYVITDSFHGTAFSCNFNKNVFVFYPPKYNTRLKSFLELLHIENRHMESYNDFDVNDINFEEINAILDNERKKVYKFLDGFLKY